MRPGVLFCLILALGGCASYGAPEEYDWTIEIPERVDQAADFVFTVRTRLKPEVPVPETAEPPEEEPPEEQARAEEVQPPEPVDPVEDYGVEFHYTIVWPGGSTSPLPRIAWSGEETKVRARVITGKATILVHAMNDEELLVKVAERSFEVE